jgi:hypothetical protein
MAIGTGQVSFSEIRDEFGQSGAISFSNYFRGGSIVRSKAGNNTADNLASDVPTSGALSVDDFKGQARGFRRTFTSGTTDVNASSVFGSDYSVDYPKEIIVNSGVELGATSTSNEALHVDSGLTGFLSITNNGTLSGAGGAANGGAAGDAFEADVNCTLINNGTIRGGGGGGGLGGTGGGGSFTSQVVSPISGGGGSPQGNCNYSCNSVYGNSGYYCRTNSAPHCTPYYIGDSPYPQCNVGNCVKDVTTNTNGGSGGAGGRGQGYGQSLASGSSGSAGGTNAGTGGTGGTGGSYGSNGATGATGANGNRTNGIAGSSGGAAGNYIRGTSFVSLTNNGTVQGGTTST